MRNSVIEFPSRSKPHLAALSATLGAWSWHWEMPANKTKGPTVEPNTIQTEANAMAVELLRGLLHDHARRYAFPLVVYIGKDILMLSDQDHLVKALSLYRTILEKEWLSVITSTVTACTSHQTSAAKISVRNRYFATDGRDLGTARITYYCERHGADRKIRMVEYLEWPCPDRIAQCLPLQRMMA